MGLPIEKLVIATNDNDILARTLETGSYAMTEVVKTTSPSMDIQISSNFERLLFKASGDSAEKVTNYMGALKQSGEFTLNSETLAAIRSDFQAGRADVNEAAQTIRSLHEKNGYLLDPHTAIGVQVARRFAQGTTPMVVLGTAHPAKFPAAVQDASGVAPLLPDWLGDLMSREEKFVSLPSDLKMIEGYISKLTRA